MHEASDNTLNAFQMQTKAIIIIACGNKMSRNASRKVISHKIEVYSNEDSRLRTADCNFLNKDTRVGILILATLL